MKNLSLILIVAFLTGNLYAQKKGYKEIQIGANLTTITALHKYQIISEKSKRNSWVVTSDSLRMFLMDIDRLEVIVNDSNVIKRISAYPKKTISDNFEDWQYNLKFLINVVNSDVGKLNSANVDRPSDNDLCFAWSFVDTKTVLFLFVPMVDRFATKVNNDYSFVWIEDQKNLADLKF